MMFAKSFQPNPAIKMTHVNDFGGSTKLPLVESPQKPFSKWLATQISGEMFTPRKLGFHDPIWRTRIFLKGVETQPPTTFVLGGHRTWGPCELHPRWCGLENFVWPKKTRTSSASRSPGPHDVGGPACFPGLNRLGNFFEMKKLLLMATRILANRMGFIQPAVNNGISTTNLN